MESGSVRQHTRGLRGVPVRGGQRLHALVGVEPTGIGQHPQFGAGQPSLLLPDRHRTIAERLTVGRDAQHRDHSRLCPADQVGQWPDPGPDLGRGQFVGPCGGERDEVGDPDAAVEKQLPVRVSQPAAGVDLVRGDPGQLQRRPEPVARTREMGVHRCGPQAGVDADEQQPQRIGDQVVHPGAAERLQLRPGEAR
jgi:hypothetical protein